MMPVSDSADVLVLREYLWGPPRTCLSGSKPRAAELADMYSS